jgi:hypothetical protein
MPANPVIWFEIYVQDIDRARRFYEAVLQIRLQKLDSPDAALELWAFPMSPDQVGAGGALCRMEGVNSGGSSTIVYFHTQDCSIEAGRVPAAGGRIHKAKTAIGPHGFIALAQDPDGNMFGLHSMK